MSNLSTRISRVREKNRFPRIVSYPRIVGYLKVSWFRSSRTGASGYSWERKKNCISFKLDTSSSQLECPFWKFTHAISLFWRKARLILNDVLCAPYFSHYEAQPIEIETISDSNAFLQKTPTKKLEKGY